MEERGRRLTNIIFDSKFMPYIHPFLESFIGSSLRDRESRLCGIPVEFRRVDFVRATRFRIRCLSVEEGRDDLCVENLITPRELERLRGLSPRNVLLEEFAARMTRYSFEERTDTESTPLTATEIRQRETEYWNNITMTPPSFANTYRRDMDEYIQRRLGNPAGRQPQERSQEEEPVDRILREVRDWSDEQLQAVRSALLLEGKRRINES